MKRGFILCLVPRDLVVLGSGSLVLGPDAVEATAQAHVATVCLSALWLLGRPGSTRGLGPRYPSFELIILAAL